MAVQDTDSLSEQHPPAAADEHPPKDRSKYKPSASTKSKDLSHVPCKFYRVGSCTAGLSCPFSHASPSRSSASNDPNNPNPPVQSKDVCAWFVKGTCKFGHKCALAHVLPGQNMAMDRKNKKAAQIAANAQAAHSGGGGAQGGGKGGKGNRAQRDHGHGHASGAGGGDAGGGTGTGTGHGGLNASIITTTTPRSNPLLSGSTAPTRSVHTLAHTLSSSPAPNATATSPSSNANAPSNSTNTNATNSPSTPTTRLQMPMPTLKATISPSAPAPPLKDTDFPNFSMMSIGREDTDIDISGANAIGEPLPSAPALPPTQQKANEEDEGEKKEEDGRPAATSPLPLSNPSRRVASTHHKRPSHDFGPIGSPPRSSPHTHSNLNNITHLNGFSPATSPPTNHAQNDLLFGGTSPFSAPAATTTTSAHFLSSNNGHNPSTSPSPPLHSSSGLGIDFKHQQHNYRSGLAASLGTAHLSAMMGGRTGSGSGAGTSGSVGAWSNDLGPVPSQVLSASVSHTHSLRDHDRERERERDMALEDEDLEEFIPGSLSDLLTPNERSRRMSRTNSGQQHQGAGTQQRPVLGGAGLGLGVGLHEGAGSRHHYSRSVPAPTLLGDLKSIWASNDSHHPLGTTNTTNHTTPANVNSSSANLGIGTPSSFKSANNMTFSGRTSLGGDGATALSYNDRESSMLSPTNASAAFLGGLHHHYLNRGIAAGGGMGTGLVQRSVSGERGERDKIMATGLSSHSNFSGASVNGVGRGSGLELGGGTAFSPPRLNAFGSRPPFSTHDSHSPSSSHTHLSHTHTHSHSHLSHELNLNGDSNTISNTNQGFNRQPHGSDAYAHLNPQTAALSPSARALQSHAPGQSLPQGLAAGYSRIHALPPPPNMGPSPSLSGVGSPGSMSGSGSPGTGGMGNMEWLSLGPKMSSTTPDSAGGTGLESMLSRLSYSAAASRPSQPSALASSTTNSPPAMPRSTTGGKPWQSGSGMAGTGGGPLSPLSGPVLTGDDDDLFSMDG